MAGHSEQCRADAVCVLALHSSVWKTRPRVGTERAPGYSAEFLRC